MSGLDQFGQAKVGCWFILGGLDLGFTLTGLGLDANYPGQVGLTQFSLKR